MKGKQDMTLDGMAKRSQKKGPDQGAVPIGPFSRFQTGVIRGG